MPAPVSIVILTLNATGSLPGLLHDLMEGVGAGLVREVVFSDGGSSDALAELAREAGAVLVEGPAGRGGQLRRGVEAARGAWMLCLHADTELPHGWSGVVEAALATPDRAGAFQLSFRARGFAPRWVAGWANLRARLFGLPYGDQGLLVSRALYDRVGGYRDIPVMEDVAMVRALRGRLDILPATVSASADVYQAKGWLRCGARNLWTVTLYSLGVAPDRLAKGYSASPSTELDSLN